jgi:hypothetical protein
MVKRLYPCLNHHGRKTMAGLDLISDLIKKTQKQIDDIEWENHKDPRIEALVRQLNYYKEQEKEGETYEPRF